MGKQRVNNQIIRGITIVLLCVLVFTGVMITSGDTIQAAQVSPTMVQYTVKLGDSLYLISRNYGITVEQLKVANAITSNLIFPGQVLRVPVPKAYSFQEILIQKGISTWNPKLDILVDKSEHTLTISSQGVQLKTYHVELGEGGSGPKQVAGDHKTPEGTFYVCEKSVLSPSDPYLGSRWMRLSYPAIPDAERGLLQGLISRQTYDSIVAANRNGTTPLQRTALGGGIGIHGGSTPALGSDWTWGCVGLTNNDVEDFYDYISIGTRVVIRT